MFSKSLLLKAQEIDLFYTDKLFLEPRELKIMIDHSRSTDTLIYLENWMELTLEQHEIVIRLINLENEHAYLLGYYKKLSQEVKNLRKRAFEPYHPLDIAVIY